MRIEDIDGIGNTTAEKLNTLGIETTDDFTNLRDIIAIKGLGADKIQKIAKAKGVNIAIKDIEFLRGQLFLNKVSQTKFMKPEKKNVKIIPKKSFTPSIYQQAIFDSANNPDNIIVEAVAGSGKCLGKGTPVLLYNGDITLVENIKTGDLLMGMDSTPKKVLSTTKGIGELFKINPVKGDSFICNDVHVLTLINSVTNEIFDIPLNEYLENKGTRKNKNAKLFKINVNFDEQKIPIDPYLFGLWLGDGKKDEPIIFTPEPEIIDYCKNIALKYNSECIITPEKNHYKLRFRIGERGIDTRNNQHYLRRQFRNTLIDNKKRIPKEYLINSEKNRLELLAGLLDTDGYLHGGYYEIMCKHKELAKDICYLARSLGFGAYCKEKISTIKAIDFEGLYYRISILGNINKIPCKVERKKAKERKQKKNVLRNGFKVESIGEGEYYGFTLDGDGRFLLGDFTVTHNTTTVIEFINYLPKNKSIVFLAFNRHIKQELETKLPSYVDVFTTHGLGLDILKRSGMRTEIAKDNNSKLDQIFDNEIIKPNKLNLKTLDNYPNRLSPQSVEDYRNLKPSVFKIINFIKNTQSPQDRQSIEFIIKRFSIEMPDCIDDTVSFEKYLGLINYVYILSIQKYSKIIDFQDMIFFPTEFNKFGKQYDYVFVDEAQDLNKSQMEIVARSLKPDGKLIAIGDSRQAIYSFRGGDSESMQNIKNRFNCKSLPLSITYRCPRSHVEYVKQFVPEIEAAPNAKEGEIYNINDDEFLNIVKENDLVLCRYNAPLISPCLRLIAMGKKARIVGSDFDKSLLKLIDNLKPKSVKELTDKLDKWYIREIKKLEKIGANTQQINDKYDCIKALIDMSGAKSINDIKKFIKEIFKKDKPEISLSTVHKAKGLEAENVFIYYPDLMPSTYAKQDWEMQQEENLMYVAYTRSLNRIYNVYPIKQ